MVQSSDKKRYVVLRLCDIRNKKKYSPLPPFLLEAEIYVNNYDNEERSVF